METCNTCHRVVEHCECPPEEIINDSAFSGLLVLQVLWRNEDELPEMTDEEYNYIYPSSKVDMVRIFPYVMIGGKEHYLRMPND